MKKLRKLPKTIKYRGRYRDYVVGVEEVSRETLRELAGDCDGYWDHHLDAEIETNLDGRIIIAKDLTLADKWKILWHERVHSAHDLGRRCMLEDEDG